MYGLDWYLVRSAQVVRLFDRVRLILSTHMDEQQYSPTVARRQATIATKGVELWNNGESGKFVRRHIR